MLRQIRAFVSCPCQLGRAAVALRTFRFSDFPDCGSAQRTRAKEVSFMWLWTNGPQSPDGTAANCAGDESAIAHVDSYSGCNFNCAEGVGNLGNDNKFRPGSPRGPIRVSANQNHIQIEIPEQTEATVLLPSGRWLRNGSTFKSEPAEAGARLRTVLRNPGNYEFVKQ